MKKIALITNGDATNEPDSLETILRTKGLEVQRFDIRNQTQPPFNPHDFGTVIRSIHGGTSGDTEKSLALQQLFEQAGATAPTPAKSVRMVNDKIHLREVLHAKTRPGHEHIPLYPATTLRLGDPMPNMDTELKAPLYVVRKQLGSGSHAAIVDHTPEDIQAAIDRYRSPTDGSLASGILLHSLPPTLNAQQLETYGIHGVDRPQDRPYHFRVVMVGRELFGCNLCYSKPGEFGLNPAQGARFAPIARERMPAAVLKIARRTADELSLNVAAIDIAYDTKGTACLLDMNTSPDLSLTNHMGTSLAHAIADHVEKLARAGEYERVQQQRPQRTRGMQ